MKNKQGFTLVEILTVVALIAILFVIFIPRIDFANTKTREAGVENDFRAYNIAFESVAKLNAGFLANDKNDTVYTADTVDGEGAVTEQGTLSKALNSYLDPSMQVKITSVTADGDTGNYKIVGTALSKNDPWNRAYTINGYLTSDGANSWMTVSSNGKDKTANLKTDATVNGVTAVTVANPAANENNAADDYSLTVIYSPTGLFAQSYGFDNNING